MTTADVLATIALGPAFVGLALSLFLLWRTELRRASMSLALLAAPDVWTITIARHGSQSAAAANSIAMHGIFAAAASNDGPRGGALWGLSADLQGMNAWRLSAFSSGQDLPYALDARSCVGWSRTMFTIACDFEHLNEGVLELQTDGEVVFTIHYICQDRWGKPKAKSTSLSVARSNLLAGFKGSNHYDLAQCQVVPSARSLVAERMAKFRLPAHELDVLTKWALLRESVECVLTPDGAPDRLAMLKGGQIDSGWSAGVGQPRDVLEQIRDNLKEITTEVDRLREKAGRL